MEYTMKQLLRRPWTTLLRLLLAAALCLLLGLLLRFRGAQQARLAEIRDSFEIFCVVTNRRGTRAESLRMPPIILGALTEPDSPLSPYIRDLRLTKEFEISAPQAGIDRGLMIGVSSERCAEALDPARGGRVQLLDQDFYGDETARLLVSRAVYESLEANTLRLSVTDPYVDRSRNPELGFGRMELPVAGWYEGSGSTVYLSFPAAGRLAYELSGRITCDSAAFLAADNRKLEALRQAASASFGEVDPLADDSADPRYALNVHDEGYRATVAAAEHNLRQANLLLPLLAALSLGLGFLLCFLIARGEARSYALMRTLGQTRGRLLLGMLLEQLLPPALAAAVVGAALKAPVPALGFLGCHTVGVLAAGLRILLARPTVILREQE